MDHEAFSAVVSFVDDLWSVYGNNSITPLALYRRLIGKINPSDAESVGKVLLGFRRFFATHEQVVLDDRLEDIPRGTKIVYGTSDRIFIEIQKYIHQANDKDIVAAIRQHLVTISAILEPDDEKLGKLESNMLNRLNIDTSTNEGQFISGIMEKAKGTMETIDSNDPQQAIMGLLGSGVIQDMIAGLQSGVASGDMDMTKLLGSMHAAMGALIPQGENSSSAAIEEVDDEVKDE